MDNMTADQAIAALERYTQKRAIDSLDEPIAVINDELTRLRTRVAELEAAVQCVSDLIAGSEGVIGLHRNGDTAPWDELLSGGQFEEWLGDFDEAR